MKRYFIVFFFFLFYMPCLCAQKNPALAFKKLSPALVALLQKKSGADSIDVIVATTNLNDFIATNKVIRLLHAYGPAGVASIRVAVKNMIALDSINTIHFIDVIKQPKEELTTGYLDIAVNKINFAQAQFPTVDGRTIVASIKEQQFDTTDIDYKGRHINTGLAAATSSSHAAIMATTLAGAGNSSPFAKGAATAAFITSTSFANLLPEADGYYKQFNISIQNHSYGTVAENYYGAEAMAYDQSIVNNTSLLAVFSAGNSGNHAGTGPYTTLNGYANLTGNFKSAKNVLTVGAIDSFYNVAGASSKGPAFDGRIKPELVAFGEDGSSGAAALTSGTAALLQQAYKEANGFLPSAALVKAVLINSADDVAAKGPDFASGYGSVNGYEAVKTIKEKRFLESTIRDGEIKNFTIHIPANTATFKITIAWTDPPAAVNTNKALVNNLDGVLKNIATGESWLPWVLSSASNMDSITKEAVRKRDTINNVEQITINNPAAGDYTLEVQGSKITTAVQAFAVAYQSDSSGYFQWTFPSKSNNIIAAKSNVLRWQSTMQGTAAMEYSTNGTSWNLISGNVNLQQKYFKWKAPDTLSTAQLRMRILNAALPVSDTFVISKAVTMDVGFNCTDSFLLFWNYLPTAQYQLYQLGNKYLAPLTVVNDTAVIFAKQNYPALFYSVAPVVNGKAGLKSFTINYTTQGVACYFRSFYLVQQDSRKATFSVLLGSLYNVATISLQKIRQNQFATIATIKDPFATAFNFEDSNLINGGNRYRLQITLRNGAVLYSDAASIYHFSDAPVFIYPNPASNGQPVTILNNAGHLTIDVFNAAGMLVQQLELNNITNHLTTIQLAKGIYFIRTTTDSGKRNMQKLLIY